MKFNIFLTAILFGLCASSAPVWAIPCEGLSDKQEVPEKGDSGRITSSAADGTSFPGHDLEQGNSEVNTATGTEKRAPNPKPSQ